MSNPWRSRRRASQALVAAIAAIVAAACSRSLPASFPSESAASPEAAPAPAARVGAMLAGDPPLPGEPSAGWPGLDDAGAGEAPPANHDHHHHHHHGAPEPPPKQDAPRQAILDGGAHGHVH